MVKYDRVLISMRNFLLIVFFSFLLGTFFPRDRFISSIIRQSLDNPQAVLFYINQYRVSLKQPELRWAENLCPLVSKRLAEIQTDFSHQNFLSIPSNVLFPTYCPYCTKINENLAKDFFDEQTLVNAWIKSPRHQENLVLPSISACINVQNGYAVLISSY